MKKKIISLFAMFCFILPCLFSIACKNKEDEETGGIEAYTYSVTLKDAKGKIDESALHSEYDYEKQENVSWTASGNDYTVSVVRTSALSGELEVSLLEGYDYSNIAITVNDEAASGEVKSGTQANCEKLAHLTDRQFSYEYENMKAESKVVVDFSNCGWATVSVDFSELTSQGITCYKASEDFVSISTETEDALIEVESGVVEVAYGTIFAFDCSQKIAFNPTNVESLQDINFAKYASRYYLGNNMIQYFTAKRNGECVVYNAVKDYSKKGTLRVLGCDDISAYSSLDDLQLDKKMFVEQEKESYGGTNLKLNVVKGSRMYFRLPLEAQNYNYYLLNNIDEVLSSKKEVKPVLLEGTSILYLDINIANDDGSAAAAKYLVRRPKNDLDYYIVYANKFVENTRISNADYILVGNENKPELPRGYQGNIFFGYAKDSGKSVEVELSQFTSDRATDFVQKNTSVSINVTVFNQNGSQSSRRIDPVIQNPLTSAALEVDCYDELDEMAFYEVYVNYNYTKFVPREVILDASDFDLFDGEKVYYSTNLQDSNSWTLLTSETELAISSQQTRTIYYYVVSDRNDAYLQIQNPAGEVVSITGELTDCFGRQMKGSVLIGNDEIKFGKIKFLDIKPGTYASYTAKLLREYENNYHTINFSGINQSEVMVSVNGYIADGSSFKDATTLNNVKIKYNGYGMPGTIYYYINSELNQYLQLKDSEGNIVSTSSYVVETNKEELVINGEYVYCLTLLGGYYADNEEFTIEFVTPDFLLNDIDGDPYEVFTTSDLTGSPETTITLGETYYFIGEPNKDYAIIDVDTEAVVLEFEKVSDIDALTAVYKFIFTFPDDANYVMGTAFKLVALSQ